MIASTSNKLATNRYGFCISEGDYETSESTTKLQHFSELTYKDG